MRNDGNKSAFELSYKRPFLILSCSDKIFILDVGNRVDVVSIDCLRPACVLNDVLNGNCNVSDRVSVRKSAEIAVIRRRHKNMNDRFEITNSGDSSFDEQRRQIIRNRFGHELPPPARFANYI